MNVSQETDFLFLCVNIFLRFSFSIVSEVKKYKFCGNRVWTPVVENHFLQPKESNGNTVLCGNYLAMPNNRN